MSAAIRIRQVHKQYGDVCALDGVDFEIRHGEFFGLLGPNGAGKSTLINIIAGLTRADRGHVAVMGHDVVTEYRQARQSIGVVPQELVFDPFFTVREVLRIQSGYFGLGRENEAWIDELLSELHLEDKANTNMRSLSGGMKRRVLIAQALVHKPAVVVLDEPTAGVDIKIRNLLWAFIQRLHERGQTIVLTTHYLEEAESMCERIAILDHGGIVAIDTKQQLLNSHLARSFTVSLTCRELVQHIPEALAAKVTAQQDNWLEMKLDKDTDSITDVLDQLRDGGIEVVDIHTERPDLEDVFLKLTYGREDVV
ncbi:MAG TPA: ABC transporter ATP-binding protein [Gammaproteobacteria bacterium]|nr:ABC transporter ATP-binding protein [Gammaproteobacteria bacterium]